MSASIKVPFLELRPAYLELKDEFDAAYRRVMDSGWYLLGEETEAFEREFAEYVGTRHCVTVGTGLDALAIALIAHGIGAGDEVIVPAHTFIATWLAVTECGAVPVPVDVREDTANLNAELLASVLTSRTKAVIPVHLYGHPADMDPILQFAQEHALVVLEDAAQAHGARYKGRHCGSLGHSAAFSFYPGKNLGAFSDGGAITTDDDEIARRARMLRNYGSEQRYHHEVPGTNSRLDELQAAFLRIKLQRLDEWNARRQELARLYLAELSGLPNVILPGTVDAGHHVWHLFVIRHHNRNGLQGTLAERGIQTLIHYPIPPHRSAVYARADWGVGAFPVAEKLAGESISLPIGPQTSAAQVGEVIAVLRRCVEGRPLPS